MPPLVVNGAQIACVFSPTPGVLVITPERIVSVNAMPAGNITDMVPFKNIMSFGMCVSPTNPAFISATAAAFGTPTPVPCTPIIAGPWAPGATSTTIQGAPALNQICTCVCTLGGVISIVNPGQIIVDVT